MKNILITGGSGFLGQHLIKELIKYKCYNIRVIDLSKNTCPLFDFGDKVSYLFNRDITDYNSIKEDFEDIDIVFHLAGLVSFQRKDKEKLYSIHVDGTKNVLKACLKSRIRRVIHVSSVAALGFNDSKENPIDERFSFDWTSVKDKHYMASKHEGEIEVIRYFDNSLNCVIANPGLMFGPGDMGNTLKMVKAIKGRKIPVNMPGGTNIVDVRDVVRGLVSLIDKGKPGNRYILGGYNYSFKKINKIIAGVVGQKPPRRTVYKIFHRPLYSIVRFFESISNKPIPLTSDNIDSSFMFRYFDSTKANKEIFWKAQIPFKQTVTDSYNWIIEKGLI